MVALATTLHLTCECCRGVRSFVSDGSTEANVQRLLLRLQRLWAVSKEKRSTQIRCCCCCSRRFLVSTEAQPRLVVSALREVCVFSWTWLQPPHLLFSVRFFRQYTFKRGRVAAVEGSVEKSLWLILSGGFDLWRPNFLDWLALPLDLALFWHNWLMLAEPLRAAF